MALSKTVAHAPGNCWLRVWAALLLFTCALLCKGGPVQSAPATEYQVKAVFLFNFAQFVEWPPHAFADRNTPLIIGVLGQDPFGSFLDETVRGERAHGRHLIVQRYRRVEDVKTCHILFIGRSESGRLEHIVATLRYRRILTVSDTEGAAKRGVIIRFVTEQNRIRFRIDLESAKAANLTISSKLLRLAEIVAPGDD